MSQQLFRIYCKLYSHKILQISGMNPIVMDHMGQYQLLSVLAARLSPLNIDHSSNLPVDICGINYTERYTNL